jgi:hypothetical protein
MDRRANEEFRGWALAPQPLRTSPVTSQEYCPRYDRLRYTLRTEQSLHPGSTPTSRPDPGASLPGTLASPRTGLTRLATASLTPGYDMTTPSKSRSRATGRTRIRAQHRQLPRYTGRPAPWRP